MRRTYLEEQIFTRQESVKLLKYKCAIIIGVGGIGSWVALNLALTGQIQILHLIDPDSVEGSNLNRTPFRFCDIGQPKVSALKYLILERRAVDVLTYQQKTTPALFTELQKSTGAYQYTIDPKRIIADCVIVDCRDDVYTDFYDMPCKYYKVGYDGLSITIDGNPRNTPVWGRANSYRFTPSFICPAQLAANLVVTDILTDKLNDEEKAELPQYDYTTNKNNFDNLGRFNQVITFDCKDIIEIIHREIKSTERNT